MLATVVIALCFVSSASATALRQQEDGFTLHELHGRHHLGYGVVPVVLGDRIQLEFYDVELSEGTSCDDVKVEVYVSGYVRTERDLVGTLCDAEAVTQFVAGSSRGFFIAITTSDNLRRGQLKVRFNSAGGIKVTHQVFYR